MTGRRPPRIAALGLASWDQFIVVDRYPAAGSFAIVKRAAAMPGGTTANSAVALSRLGAQVSLVSVVGDDEAGQALRASLEAEGVDLRWLGTKVETASDATTVVVSHHPQDRTIFWHQGARLVRGDQIDIAALFSHDLVLVDADDLPLRRLIVDLPAHTAPAARLLGALTYLADSRSPDALAIVLGHDAIVGNERELSQICGSDSLDAAVSLTQDAMRTANLRAAAISRGSAGATVFTARERWDLPAYSVNVIDATGAGDAFAAGIAYGMTLRWPWPRAGRFANAVAALSTRALGSQTALPSLHEVASMLGENPATLGP